MMLTIACLYNTGLMHVKNSMENFAWATCLYQYSQLKVNRDCLEVKVKTLLMQIFQYSYEGSSPKLLPMICEF